MRRDGWLWMVIAGVVLLSLPALWQRAELERRNDVVEIIADLDSLRVLSAYTGVALDDVLAQWASLGVTSAGVFNAADVEVVERAGLIPVPRTMQAVAALTGREPAGGLFIASGEAMPGYPGELAATASLLQRGGFALGIVEFAEQAGERELAALLGDQAVTVHSIPPRELARLTDEQAVARFNRAVLERQARALYVHALVPAEAGATADAVASLAAVAAPPDATGRPDDADGQALLERNAAYVAALLEKVRLLGLTAGPVQPVPRWASSSAVPVAVAMAAAAAALLAGRGFVRLSWPLEPVLVAAAGGLAAVLALTGHEVWARQGAAFAAACAFPVLAVLAGVAVGPERGSAPPDFLRRLAVVLSVTWAGAALVAAALLDTRFFLKLELFRGVKAAHLLPIAAVAAAWAVETVAAPGNRARVGQGVGQDAVGDTRRRPTARDWAAALARLVRSIGWRHVAAGTLAAAAVFVLIARTGNNLLPVSSWEVAARTALEEWLVVRPRTKEFLFGYPALLLGLACFAVGHRRWGWPLAAAGVVAPVSVINTFSHAHVALWVSVVRTAYGLMLGAGVAAAAGALLVLGRKLRAGSAGLGGGDVGQGKRVGAAGFAAGQRRFADRARSAGMRSR